MNDFTDNVQKKADDAKDWVGDKIDDAKDWGQDRRADAREEKGRMEGEMDDDEAIEEDDNTII